jgi:hypothetical protein
MAVLRVTGASTIYTANEKAATKLVSELNMNATDKLKLILRVRKLTKLVPDSMRPIVAVEEQRKANVVAIM